MFSIEFQPPFLFRCFWITLEASRAIPEMVDGRQTIEPFELQRLIDCQSDERVWLMGIRLVSPWKNSSLAAHPCNSIPANPLDASAFALGFRDQRRVCGQKI
jgi:hypothetical protein